MKKTALVLGLALLSSAVPAAAATCTIDAVPGSTLLLPYFEVNLGDPNGLTTLFSVNNANKPATLVHVVMWSDLAVPVLSFDVYLTGYDVQSINLRDIIVNGNLPQTAPVNEDPNDTISPKGPFSQDTEFPNCQGRLPPPSLPAFFTAHLQAALTGQPSLILQGNCAGQALGDNIARGYITMDTVNSCSSGFPSDAGYFAAGGTGTASNQGHIWGDWYIINQAQNFAQGGTLVHIEADATNAATTTSGNYTFYGRYDGWSAADNREPLATHFGTRYLTGGPFTGGTSLLVWRDPKVIQAPFTCPAAPGVQPAWYPLGQEGIVIFDEQEHVSVITSDSISPNPAGFTIPFPPATQRTQVNGQGNGPSLPVPFNFGWFYLDLNTTVTAAGNNPPVAPTAAQAWVFSTISSNGHFAVGIDGIQFDSACAPSHFLPH